MAFVSRGHLRGPSRDKGHRAGYRPGRAVHLCLALIGLLAVLTPHRAAADAALSLQLVTGPDYKPYTDPALPLGGMHSEIVRAAFEKAGDKVAIVFEPWTRGYAEAERLLFDATFPYSRSPERAKDFLYSDDIDTQTNRPYVLAESSRIAARTADLAGTTLCSPRGYLVTPPIQALLEQKAIRLERPNSMEQCFQMLQLHRVDAVISNEIQAQATAQHLFGRREAVKPLAAIIAVSTHNLIVARNHPGGARIIADFNRGLALLKASGEFDAIVTRQLAAYFGSITN